MAFNRSFLSNIFASTVGQFRSGGIDNNSRRVLWQLTVTCERLSPLFSFLRARFTTSALSHQLSPSRRAGAKSTYLQVYSQQLGWQKGLLRVYRKVGRINFYSSLPGPGVRSQTSTDLDGSSGEVQEDRGELCLITGIFSQYVFSSTLQYIFYIVILMEW